jgi:hypothetical protein
MANVTVVFANGNVVNFAAQEFDADLIDTMGPGLVNRFPYKDADGKDSAIHLKPNAVVGVFVTPRADVISTTVPAGR